MFDSQCDLAALVYNGEQDPDGVLRAFAAELRDRGYRAVGLLQVGHHCVDAPNLSATLIHTGEELQLFQDLRSCAARDNGGAVAPRDNGKAVARGCRLDVGQLLNAGAQMASAIDQGADLVIVNRFGRQEREGKGLAYLIERALSADIPVVIAVPSHRFADWIKFADGMSVKLPCDLDSLHGWWDRVAVRNGGYVRQDHRSVCEVLK
jgi:hypothetical protein